MHQGNHPPSFENDKVAPDAEGSRIITVSFAPQTKTYLDKDGFQPKFEDGKDTVLISNTNALDTCVVSVDDKTGKATISTDLTGPLTAVYPYTAAGMNENNENEIDTVLVSTIQSGKFADANICMAKMTSENDESLSFENKTAVFCIKPATGASSEYVEVKAEGFNIANDYPEGSTYTTCNTIHVAPITTDSVYVSILVPDGLNVSDLTFSDGTKEKSVTPGATADKEIAAGTLYTVNKEGWKSPEADTPDGALTGVFTVGAGPDGEAGTADDVKVYFSKGNLYYDGSSFKFEVNQYAAQSSWNANHVSLFFWSRDASVADVENYKDISKAANDVFFTNATAETAKSDFTVNGVAGKYRTLSDAEWQYIFDTRTASTVSSTSNARYAKATVNSKSGIILLPDTYEHPSGVTPLTSINTYNAAFTANNYDVTDWTAMESAGAVFLPAAGFRDGSSFHFIGSNGVYWSSSASDLYSACGIGFTSEGVFSDSIGDRNAGASVRLVTDVSAAPAPTEPDFVVMKMGSDHSKSLKWATMNLGAEKVATDYKCYGDYYQWGSVDKLYTSITWTDNTTGSFVGLKTDGFAETNLTYNEDANLSDATNDVVRKTYPGTGWRMPTSQEFLDLYDACVGTDGYDKTTKPTTGKPTYNGVYWCDSYDGVSGCLFYDGTNVLFFPAACYGEGEPLINAGPGGNYWSSTLYSDFTDGAYSLSFFNDDVYPQYETYRYCGFPIRPVSDL